MFSFVSQSGCIKLAVEPLPPSALPPSLVGVSVGVGVCCAIGGM